jgi:peptidoglycan/LPS O-acetylase OafA/YrhL
MMAEKASVSPPGKPLERIHIIYIANRPGTGVRMRNFPSVTGLRGVAALAVVAFHAYLLYATRGYPSGPANPLFNYGWIGVDLFFVLSGFLLALPLLSRPANVREAGFWAAYLPKRFLRIAPPYYASILVVLAVQDKLSYLWAAPKDLLYHVFYVHNFHQPYFGSISGVYWTLAIEFQFYLVLPLAALLFTRRRWPYALAGSALLSLVWRFASFDPDRFSWLALQLPGFWAHFALGIAAARLHVDGWRPRFNPNAMAVAWLVLFVVAPLHYLAGPGYSYGTHQQLTLTFLRPLLGLGFAGLILLTNVDGGAFQRLLSHSVAQTLGEVSYSLYLIHVPVMLFVVRYPANLLAGFGAFALACVAGSVAAALAYYRLVEAPSLRLKDWLTSPRAPSPRPTTLGAPTAVMATAAMVDSRPGSGSGA